MGLPNIENFSPITGRQLGENGIVNTADQLKIIADNTEAGINLGGNPVSEGNRLPVSTAENDIAVVTFAAGATKSNVIDKRGKLMTVMELNDWTAADVTFLGCSTSDGTFRPVYDDYGNEATAIVSGNISVTLARLVLVLAPVNFIQLRSGHVTAEVSQAAARTINLPLSR